MGRSPAEIHTGYYKALQRDAELAAERILPIMFEWGVPSAMVDVGCGPGGWVRVARRLGVGTVVGIDGPWAEEWIEDEVDFLVRDLGSQLAVDDRFDLAISLEVAQYLPAARAAEFVADLCALAPRVLFSSRIPFQWDFVNSNDQWPSWWATLFAEHKRVPVDMVRPRIWNDSDLPVYYRQNILLFVPSDDATDVPAPLDLVHPEIWTDFNVDPRRALTAASVGELGPRDRARRAAGIPRAAAKALIGRAPGHTTRRSRVTAIGMTRAQIGRGRRAGRRSVEEEGAVTEAATRNWPTRAGGPVRAEYLVFGSPQILEPEIDEMVATLRSAWLGTGPRTNAFEAAFAAYVGVPQAIALNSGTAALHLSLIALGLGPGDEVIVPSLTFASTANAVVHAGGRPVLADVDRATLCLDPDDAAGRITPRTRAIVPVHFAGRPCAMDEISALACHHGLSVVEDCAHAIETTWHGLHAGTLGDFGAFSFYATKNVVTGEGGMLVTADSSWAARVRTLALHGLSADAWTRFRDSGFQHYEVREPGFKYNMTDMQAALGIHQLARVEPNLQRRHDIWSRYDAAFADLPAFLPAGEEDDTRHARHLYTLILDIDQLAVTRDEVMAALHRQNIGTGLHYRAVHLYEYYRKQFGYQRGDLPVSEWISDRTMSLPLSPKLTDSDVDDVIVAVHRTLEHFAR